MWRLIAASNDVEATSIQDVSTLVEREDVRFWIDVESPDQNELESLAAALRVDGEAVDDALSGEQRSRVDDYDDYAFVVTYSMLGEAGRDDYSLRKLSIICGARFIVTVHSESIGAIDAMRRRAEKNGRGVMADGPGGVLYSILDQIVDNYLFFIDSIETEVDRLEDLSLHKSCTDAVLIEASTLRRHLADLRHLAIAQDQLINAIVSDDFPFMDKSLAFHFSHVRQHLMIVVEFTDKLRDRLHGVRDNYSFVLAHRTNEIMRVLTVFASILLPLSLLTSIYGMNVAMWPSPKEPYGIWVVLLVMLGLAGMLFGFFKRKNWL
ncbi:MAG: magnesium transporter CorA family protein [Phycisphaerales bacterium]|nr:magnesium transporter CorA family protein [Phycisphaerales bacterium]MCB9854861.1 magnesium transporter CorA family protein [Phycisphaerales bacterium]